MNRVDESPTERILLLDSDDADLISEKQVLEKIFPRAAIHTVSNLFDGEALLAADDFDIVVVDYTIPQEKSLHFLQSLKLKEQEPAVVFLTRKADAQLILELHNFGVQRLLVKDGNWEWALGATLRQLLRIRRLEEENRSMVAKLTEANLLLEEKNKRLDEFSATIAHDIRGPLGSVSMRLEYVLDSHNNQFEPKVSDILTKALVSVNRLTDIVQAMYDFAKLGAKAAKMKEVNLGELIGEVVSDLHFDDSLDIEIEIGELSNVWGNPELLRRVFGNLISNAVKYNDKEKVQIRVGLRKRFSNNLGNMCEIEVSDNGPGIPEDEQKEIFTLFRRGAGPRAQKEGLGVGLAVVHRIVELHFGKVVVESVPHKGTTFLLTLPEEQVRFTA